MAKSKKTKSKVADLMKQFEKSPRKHVYVLVIIVTLILISLFGLIYVRNNPGNSPFDSLAFTPEKKVLRILRRNERTNDVDELKGLVGSTNETFIQLFLERGAHFEPGVPLFTIGDEFITSDDINVYFYTSEQPTLISKEKLSDEQILKAIDEVKKASITYQELTGDTEKYANGLLLNKDRSSDLYQIRARNVSLMEEEFHQEHVNSIKGERVTMWWYNNQLMPPMGLDDARAITKAKMQAIHEDLISNKISMDDAAERIMLDTEHYEIDFATVSNAYYIFDSQDGFDIYIDPKLNEKLFELKEGGYSELLVGNDFDGETWYPAFYTIIHISEISGDGLTLDQLYKNVLDNYLMQVI